MLYLIMYYLTNLSMLFDWERFKRVMYRQSDINTVSKERQRREGRLESGYAS